MTRVNGIPYGRPTEGATTEGDGYVFTCTCLWVKWWPRQSDAAEGRLKHQKACKKSGGDA